MNEVALSKVVENIDLWALKKSNAEDFLDEFAKQAWFILEPGRTLLWNWHLEAICEHLTAVTNGEIRNLIINIPPRCMKSLLTCVFWPVWVWIKQPQHRWLFSSYAQDLSVRDSMKCRRIIESPWFQARWADRFYLLPDQNEKKKFENNRTGYRISTSTEGRGTGEGGDTVVVDDPHNVLEALSTKKREAACLWWSETMSSRLNDSKTGAKVIVMQRLHERDLTGYVLEKARLDGDQYVHLKIPMRYDERICKTMIENPLGWKDPRQKPGEVMWPERFPEERVRKLEANLGQYGAAGQLQQEPAPRGGGLFKAEDFKIVKPEEVPEGGLTIRYWDMAATELGPSNDPDWTAGCLMKKVQGQYFILNIRRFRESPAKNKALLKQTAEIDGFNVHIHMEQEPGSSGKAVIDDYARTVFSGFVFRAHRPTGSKLLRAEPLVAAVENGLVHLVQGDWNLEFIQEALVFPAGTHDDQIDATSGAFAKLNEKRYAKQLKMRH